MADRTQRELDPAAETVEAPAARSGGGLKAFLPLILTALLMPAVAWAMTAFVLVPKLQKSLGVAPAQSEHGSENGAQGAAAQKGGAKETVTMTKLLVNVSGTMGSRYLLATLTLSSDAADFRIKMEKNEAKLRDMALATLETKTINDLEKPGARNLVRSELLTGFNNILGGGTVQELYITEFAIQ